MSKLKPDMWTAEHDEMIVRFLKNTNLTVLIAYVDPNTGFHINTQPPAFKTDEMSYLIRQQGVMITKDNIARKLQFGTIKGNHIESLLRIMTNVYAPLIFGNRSWPIGIFIMKFFTFERKFVAKDFQTLRLS